MFSRRSRPTGHDAERGPGGIVGRVDETEGARTFQVAGSGVRPVHGPVLAAAGRSRSRTRRASPRAAGARRRLGPGALSVGARRPARRRPASPPSTPPSRSSRSAGSGTPAPTSGSAGPRRCRSTTARSTRPSRQLVLHFVSDPAPAARRAATALLRPGGTGGGLHVGLRRRNAHAAAVLGRRAGGRRRAPDERGPMRFGRRRRDRRAVRCAGFARRRRAGSLERGGRATTSSTTCGPGSPAASDPRLVLRGARTRSARGAAARPSLPARRAVRARSSLPARAWYATGSQTRRLTDCRGPGG